MTDAERIDLTMVLHHETAKAVLVSDGGDETYAVWLPKSQIEVEVIKGNEVVVTIPEWLAHNKGLI